MGTTIIQYIGIIVFASLAAVAAAGAIALIYAIYGAIKDDL